MTSPKARNCSIDIFRLICAIFIVAIHTELFSDVNSTLSYVCTQILSRIALPFFFATSGYFYIQKLEKGVKPFFAYAKKLLITYTLWSCIYFLLDFITWGHTNIVGFGANCIYSFFLIGSHYHLWFFIALFICICAVTLAYRLRLQKLLIPLCIILYVIGCLGEPYFAIGEKIPVLNNLYLLEDYYVIRRYVLMNIPFFISGYAVCKLKAIIKDISNKKLVAAVIFTTLMWLAEIALLHSFHLQRNVILSVALYPLIIVILLFLLQNPVPQLASASNKCRIIANFTYYAHPLFIELLRKITCIPPTPMFIAVVAVTCICGIVIARLNKHPLNMFVN